MRIAVCSQCSAEHAWDWDEAFNKFGFGDGDGLVHTATVVEVLTKAGYKAESFMWGMHNTIISSIKRKGKEQIPESAVVGYDDPREYLPRRIVKLLDKHFG
ncbi:MAG: hypothetical protein ABL901_03180 [Hyphomicrobiaceae bacterium]